jgi:tryptophanyl-tRNA synthetase
MTKEEFKVDPWKVEGKIDYEKLIKKFGTNTITEELKEKLRQKTKLKKLHRFFRRNFIFSHRDLDKIIDNIDKNNFFIYTGRGPSGNMHIGHLISFITAKWFQDEFNCNVYIMISDDEKYVVKKHMSLEDIKKQTQKDFEDIAAIGFNTEKTFMFSNTEFIKQLYPYALKFGKKINYSIAKAVFGFNNETNIGHIFYPSIQIIPTVFENKYCLIPAGIDQDPYWRIQRDIAKKLGYKKIVAVHNKLLIPLQGNEGKMSSSNEKTAIYLTDTPKEVKNKINKYAFSGGRPTLEEHKKLGGNPDIDVAYNWLEVLFEEDDNKIKDIYNNYKSGKMTTGEIKTYLIDKINEFLIEHRKKKEKNKKLLGKYKYTGKLAKKMWSK